METGYTPTDGLWTAFLMNGDPSVWQVTGHTIAAGDIFELKVDARITYAATDLQVTLFYDDGGTRVPLATKQIAVSGTMQEYTLICAAADVSASVGHSLGIEFENVTIGGDTWIGLDKVRLEVLDRDPRLYASHPDPADGTVGLAAPLLRWTPGETAMFHDVYIGTTAELGPEQLAFARYPTTTFYYTAPLQPGTLYHWRIDEVEKDNVTIHTGDVWSFVMQDLTAYYPSPANGATDAAPAPTLTWRAGQGAVKHHLYFSDSNDAVSQGAADANQGDFALADTAFVPGALESLRVYYWRVDEILIGGVVRPGPVWSFTTHLPVDDFESYNDEENQGTRIYETWVDGWTNNNGSTVGYTEPPFAEQTIVHGGLQSMPLDYNNIVEPFYSEAVREFTPAEDWTTGDVDALVLYVQGRSVNGPAQLYVRIEDSSQQAETIVHPDPAVVTTAKWTTWKIPFAELAGVNLSRVKKIHIGLGDRTNPVAGGTGLIFIDDICLTKPAPAGS